MIKNHVKKKSTLYQKMKRDLARLKKENASMDTASWGYEEGILITGNEAKEIISLIEWKKSAMKVLNDINLQEVGKAIGLKPGEDIAKNILPFIQKLKSQTTSPKAYGQIIIENPELLKS